MAGLGERELEVLHVLWQQGGRTVGDVRDALAAPLAYTTVLTILRNLEAKGLVTHAVDGRAHRYSARVAKSAVHDGAIARMIRTVFQGNAFGLLSQLVANEPLSDDELRELSAMVKTRIESSATPRKPARGRR